eukprot:5096636-Pyramimonas_sp.AAC.1
MGDSMHAYGSSKAARVILELDPLLFPEGEQNTCSFGQGYRVRDALVNPANTILLASDLQEITFKDAARAVCDAVRLHVQLCEYIHIFTDGSVPSDHWKAGWAF